MKPTIESTIEYLKEECNSDYAEVAIEALEKANKYKWHDLRKNPEDLPSHNKKVIVYYRKRNSENTLQYGTDRIISDYPKGWRGFQKGNRVIAWKEIEGFEVEE